MNCLRRFCFRSAPFSILVLLPLALANESLKNNVSIKTTLYWF
jgi:hypothetical protein